MSLLEVLRKKGEGAYLALRDSGIADENIGKIYVEFDGIAEHIADLDFDIAQLHAVIGDSRQREKDLIRKLSAEKEKITYLRESFKAYREGSYDWRRQQYFQARLIQTAAEVIGWNADDEKTVREVLNAKREEPFEIQDEIYPPRLIEQIREANGKTKK